MSGDRLLIASGLATFVARHTIGQAPSITRTADDNF